MSLSQRIAANLACRTPNCERTTDWPTDPDTRAAYCKECTQVVMSTGRPPRLPVFVPAWRRNLPARDETGDNGGSMKASAA